jgi:AraC family transcriptional regulator
MRLADIHPALVRAAQRRDEDVSLHRLAAETRLSPFHLHRAFTAITGETPKQYTQRLRLEQAAALLLSTDLRVIDVALSCGFESHEVFTRAFRRCYAATPLDFRQRGRIPVDSARALLAIGPCLHLYHFKEPTMPYTIDLKTLSAQPIVAIRQRVKRSEIPATIGQSLGVIVTHAMQHGAALLGHPITRYHEMSAGMVTMEPAMRVSAHPPPDPTGAILNETLPAGPAACTTHMGPYDGLSSAYGALEEWMHDHGYATAGPPWEDYVTDPAEHPDTATWRTDVYWPVCKPD